MKSTKETLKAIKEIEKKVAKVCDASNDIVNDEITGLAYPKKTTKKKSRKIEINLKFGLTEPSLKYQLNKQGFELDDYFLFKVEELKFNLHSLNQDGILTVKQLLKCFHKLNNNISEKVVASQLKEGEIAKHVKTIIG
jgi:hypothetical protein